MIHYDAQAPTHPSTSQLRRLGFVGYGYVGRGTARALGEVAETRFHDPAVSGSWDLDELVAWADAVFVCVPTPMSASGAADLGIVFEVLGELARAATDGLVVLKSTVPPGTSAEIVRRWPHLPLVFNPEFLRERHHLEDARSPVRVVLGWTAGIDAAGRSRVRGLYRRRFPEVPLVEMGATEAELLKYASNALFGVKVSFADELARRLGVGWEPVRRALVLDPRVGDGHLTVPGPDGERGFGGSCLPKDMAGLLAVGAECGIELEVVEAAVRGNRRRRG